MKRSAKSKIQACITVVLAMMAAAGLFMAGRDAAAQTAPATTQSAGVVATAAPVVVRTTPEAGAKDVDPKLTEIKVTFSKDMQDGNWSFVQVSDESFPKTVGKPKFLEDKRTCVLTVQLEPGKGYIIWINRAPYNSFMDPDGRRAVPYQLVFETRK